MNYAVTDCADLAHVGDNAELGIGEGLNNEPDGIGVGRDDHAFLGACTFKEVFVVEDADGVADPFAYTLGENSVVRGVKKLIFQ